MGIFKRKTKPSKIFRLDELEPMLASDRPVLVDLVQSNCQSCRIMDGIINEVADEFGDTAHVVKIDVGIVPGAIEEFKVRSTPTFVVLGRAPAKRSKRQRRNGSTEARPITQRWRVSGLVKKDQIVKVLESNGAQRAVE